MINLRLNRQKTGALVLIEDHVFVERARNGESGAFRELVERYKQKVYYLALDLTGNHHDAEDLSQEVFIKTYRYLKGFRGDAKFSSWLYRITVNTCIDQNRKKSVKAMRQHDMFDEKKITQSQGTPQETQMNPELVTEAGLIQKHIDNALKKLTEKERAVFVLRHYNQLQLKEIADILHVTVGTVKSTLFRALQRLQKELSFFKSDLGLETPHAKM